MLMIDRRYFRYFDWFSFFVTLLLLGLGLLLVFSSTYRVEKPVSLFFKKQVLGALAGLGIYFFFCIKDLRRLARLGFWIYIGVLVLLTVTLVCGKIGMGGQRWISLYFIRFQPSELAKLFFPFFIAHFLEDLEFVNFTRSRYLPTSQFMVPLIVLLISFVLIAKQPDLGTALLILFSGFITFWFIGINREFFLTLALIGMLGAPFFWNFLKPYQQQRILVLFGYGDARKERYQVEQSKIAIGSGGIVGKGLLQGTQNKLGFLPEDHTDFIFSVACEEFGFIGAMLILLLFFLMFARIIFIIAHIPPLFEQIIGIGLLIHILISVCINLGMVTGILPAVGIPLPLFTSGVSNLWITLASLGGLNNIAIRRFYY
ncbi:MAG: FtsW/RodA/SpoVE family cell cycle protein [bacterium]